MNTFYKFDYSDFPNVKIMFKSDVVNSQVDDFFSEWLAIYDFNQDFNILFDVTQVKKPTFKMACKMIRFIKKLRKQIPQLFRNSFIICPNSTFMKFLFKFVFTLSKPVSRVYVYWNDHPELDVNMDNVAEIFEANPEIFQYIANV